MKLHVLGSAGYHANDYRETTCMMIPELGIILDAGSGFRRVRKLLDQVPAGKPLQVLISHGHIDHTLGLTFGINVFSQTGRKVTVIGARNHLEAIEKELFGGALFPLKTDHPLLDYRYDHLGAYVPCIGYTANEVPYRFIDLPHPGGSTGYRLSLPNGNNLVYITDTSADDVPTEFVAGAHTLIHECNFTDDLAELARNSKHSTTGQVIALAKRAGVKRLVLMHWNTFIEMELGMAIKNMSGIDPNDPSLPFEVILADDQTVIDL